MATSMNLSKVLSNFKFLAKCRHSNRPLRGYYGERLFTQSGVKFNYYSRAEAHLNIPENTFDDEGEETHSSRHPGLRRMPAVHLPERLVQAIHTVIESKGYSSADLQKKSEVLANYLGSRKPPPRTRNVKKKGEDIATKLDRKTNIDLSTLQDAEAYHLIMKQEAAILKTLKKELYHWKPIEYTPVKAMAYALGSMPMEYAVLKSVFKELLTNDPSFKPQSLFDFGSGVGTTLWAANDHWDSSLNEYFCVDTSAHMNEFCKLLVQDGRENKAPFMKTIYHKEYLPASNDLTYDLVVCSHSLLELPDIDTRVDTIRTLWEKTEKYLVVVERGTYAGFEMVNEARDFILMVGTQNIRQRRKLELPQGHVVAPCSHSKMCPRFFDGSLTPCNFEVKYYPFSFAKEPIAKSTKFSYVILKKGEKSTDSVEWPRIVRSVLKKNKHVVCRLCCSDGQLYETVLSKGKNSEGGLYKCARKSEWGDLLPVTVVLSGEKEKSTKYDDELLDKDNLDSRHASPA